MENWFKRTDLNHILKLESLTESKLLRALDSIKPENIEYLERIIFENVKEKYKLDTDGIIYDVTNTYLYGKKCELGLFGKDKGKVKGRPLIQIGLGVTRKEGIPIFHKVFNGNVSDSRTLHDLITSCKGYGVNFGVIIYDRGFTSASNIKELKRTGLDTICGVPSNNKLKIILKKIVYNYKVEDLKRRIKIDDSIFYVFREKHSLGDVNGVLLICYNSQKGKDLRESRNDEIQNAQLLIKDKIKIKSELEKFFDKNGKIDYEKVYDEEKLDGFSLIFSSLELSSEEILKLYFQDKDIIEKSFQSLKGIVKIRPIRHWLYNRVEGHIFICYLSYLLLSLLRLKLKKLNMSPVKALKELDTLYKVYIQDEVKGFKLERTVALTKVQEDILKCIDKKLLVTL
jgi:transposase